MPILSQAYVLPVAVGILSSLAVTYASISLEPLLLRLAPRDDTLAMAASWIPVLLAAIPSILVGLMSVKRPMLLGFIAALAASLLFYTYIALRSVHPVQPWELLGFFNTACQTALYGAFFAGAGYLMGSNNSFKRTSLRAAA